ncbi:fluoride efflux transporter CrcB [Raineya orbicola]|jgi:CrcB protein|uniref:Fluoride-specific ion channel FluC n=1 Tax=Raineya orbicola TaxID=2016530 RepID=A0A2N3IKE6_9BACT|nr:fluoride efflux transporter CrcB [Raineya orbicola]PKQ70728.1 crcB: protein CrcB [Raineya orbicola]
MIQNIIWVFLGGGLGCVSRYGVNILASAIFSTRFPFGTLIVNLVGSFLIGVFFALHKEAIEKYRLLLVTGFLGGFTTFSAFSYETLALAEKSLQYAFWNVLLNVIGSLGAVFLAYRLFS